MEHREPPQRTPSKMDRFTLDATLNRFDKNRLLVLQLINIFLNDGPRIMRELSRVAKHQQVHDALRHVHHLKTLVGNFSDTLAYSLAEELETQLQFEIPVEARARTIQGLSKAVLVLVDELCHAKHQLETELFSGGSTPTECNSL